MKEEGGELRRGANVRTEDRASLWDIRVGI